MWVGRVLQLNITSRHLQHLLYFPNISLTMDSDSKMETPEELGVRFEQLGALEQEFEDAEVEISKT